MTSRPPKKGKGSSIQARVTQDVRDEIDAEAERTGRSVSQVVEVAIERGRIVADLGALLRVVADIIGQEDPSMLSHVPPSERPRPDGDLAQVKVSLDWKTITLRCDDEAALGRIFMWLIGQVDLSQSGESDPPSAAGRNS
ncbi:MAG TPA: ribbon-helix-helix protein, CopG family [Caulobacteraceae bacterium]|jgi:hypothetical protein